MVTTEFAPIGLLTQMAADLGHGEAELGLTVTLFAWIGAGSGLLAAGRLGSVSRKPLLICLMLMMVAANAATMAAPTYAALLGARALGAVANGVFWALAAATATRIAPPGRAGLATAIIFGGISIATVAGVPLANLIGHAWNWRAAFGAIGALAAVAALLMLIMLPPIPGVSSAARQGLGFVLRAAPLRRIYLVTACATTAHFWAYTFIDPYLSAVPGMPATMVATLLLAFGAAGVLGNIAAGVLLDRHLREVTLTALAGLCAALIALGIIGPESFLAPIALLLACWGASITALFTCLQAWILRAAGNAATSAAAGHTAVLNGAIGCGATLGGIMLAKTGVAGTLLSAGAIAAIAMALALRQRFPAAAGSCNAPQSRLCRQTSPGEVQQ
ncbi:MFS transporter [Achromobacter pestifer]|uniref:MFS transporter n=1 Tax=Achromobacter pestifer TaxID=1353889 RepID=A0A7D4IMW1_9BURK|nr:MFS transporter [Achromobacter pestifer]QKH39163.1 MFS transporter [Achromobacter pestifer]